MDCPAFLLVSGTGLAGAALYAHVGGLYVKLPRSTCSLADANMRWLEQV